MFRGPRRARPAAREGRLHVLRRVHRVRRAVGNHPAVDEDNPVTPAPGLFEVVRHHHHGAALVGLSPQQGHELFLRGHVHPSQRFVEQQQVPLPRQHSGKQHPLTLAPESAPM
ncbi:hypothetical protein MSS93_05030 [Deinococcus radiodurans]|nr:hypothetical protein MSS93_05030 [Deinococcus radiodurans]